jgi:hypothetical protein
VHIYKEIMVTATPEHYISYRITKNVQGVRRLKTPLVYEEFFPLLVLADSSGRAV